MTNETKEVHKNTFYVLKIHPSDYLESIDYSDFIMAGVIYPRYTEKLDKALRFKNWINAFNCAKKHFSSVGIKNIYIHEITEHTELVKKVTLRCEY